MFRKNYLEPKKRFDICECHFVQNGGIVATLTVQYNKNKTTVTGEGNGRLDAVSNAIKSYFNLDYVLTGYEQHALTDGSRSQAISYVGVEKNGRTYWGAGVDDDIIKSSYYALASAVNNLLLDL